MTHRIVFFIVSFLIVVSGSAQTLSKSDIEMVSNLVDTYKEDLRGPYKDIRWFCADGTFNDPKVPCNQEGSIQRARYKDDVVRLGETKQIFLGQILAGSDFIKFWDEKNLFDRFKQYQLEKFFRVADDGWINRKAQFYRGAMQVEDEMKWGRDFLHALLADDTNISEHFFILRQAVATIPHDEDDNTKQLVRSLSKNISDEDIRFMNLRIKIHGEPDKTDIKATNDFLTNTSDLKSSVKSKLTELTQLMSVMYAPVNLDKKIKEISSLPASTPGREQAIDAFGRFKEKQLSRATLVSVSDALISLRESLLHVKSPTRRLQIMDFSVDLEDLLYSRLSELSLPVLGDLAIEICNLTAIAYACGYLESWEWAYLEEQLSSCQYDQFGLYDVIEFHDNAKNGIEWGSNMVRAYYNPTINKIGQFEPLAYGLIDDIIRSGPLLYLGQRVSRLGEWLNNELKYANSVMGIPQSSQIRGLNAGYAKGVLEIVSGDVENLEIDKTKVYIFDQPPSDLKPIAGIATVSEGNPVSHIQLLARNLGIPNAVVSIDDFRKLKQFAGQEVFYAVSNKGTVILKNTKDMSTSESNLFSAKTRSEEKISVPTDKLKLSETTILNLRHLDKEASGIYCGPKAANLGELKKHFPDNVVEGLVIPFGIFRQHMDQIIPGESLSYWAYITQTFENARDMASKGSGENEIEKYQLSRLEELRGYIKKIKLLPEFEKSLEEEFISILNGKLGTVPVFLRSDTNMEDLKDFTGAGLNLTLFNVLDKPAILQGIKDVWASPFNERSFKWRQKFLLNPESVFPSILIIPSVDVAYSGVLITKGLKTDSYDDLTIAFNRGVGGAVDGQAAESYTLHHKGVNYLNAPSREIKLRYLPATGGSAEAHTDFSKPILSESNIFDIRMLAEQCKSLIKFSDNPNQKIAHDVEFGFLNNKIWLFQVRPFVENNNAKSSEYLNSISPPTPPDKVVLYQTQVN